MTAVRKQIAVLLMVVFAAAGPAWAAKTVFDPWNRVENAFTAKKMAEQVGISVEQLMRLKHMVDLTIGVLQQATWIHDAVTGEWSIQEHVTSWLRRRLDLFIAINVPGQYRELVHAAVNKRIMEYFRQRRARYPVLTIPDLDPWNPDSTLSRYFQDAQASYDASHAVAEQTYDDSQNTLRNLEALQSQLPQKDVNSSMTLVGQILIENGVTFADWKRANAVHEKAAAQSRSREIEARRQWQSFIGVPNPQTRYGYRRP